jgi:hypothetical protein
VLDDRCAHDDQMSRPFGVHGGQACQMSNRDGCPARPKSAGTGDMWLWTYGQEEITLGSRR